MPGVAVALLVALAAAAPACQAFAPGFAEFGGERVRGPRARAAQQDAMLELRLDAMLAAAMQTHDVDCWLVFGNGPVADPLFRHLTVTGTWIEGRAALLLCRGAGGLSRLALGRGLAPNAALYELLEAESDERLAELLGERLVAADPARIAIDRAAGRPLADGLSATDEDWLLGALPAELTARMVSSAALVETFLAGQLESEAPLFIESARLTAAILAEVLSDQVVVAAGTSLADLEWAVRERALAVGGELAYPPRAAVYRSGQTLDLERRMELDLLLQPGDLFFLSAGVRYLGYANRYGRWAYLLREGERAAPPWVEAAIGELADAVEAVGEAVRPGLDAAAAEAAASAALQGFSSLSASIARAGRLAEGPADPESRPAAPPWHPEYRLASGTGVLITVRSLAPRPGFGEGPLPLTLVETALLTGSGARFIMPPQRTPLLID